MEIKTILVIFAFVVKTISADENATCIIEDFYKYPCANKMLHYALDNGPADFGISAGEYEEGKQAYVGAASFLDMAYIIVSLQLDPPGVIMRAPGQFEPFSNDSSRIWYLYNDLNHYYQWVDSQNGESPPFAVSIGQDQTSVPLHPGRVLDSDGFVSVGTVSPYAQRMIGIQRGTGRRQFYTSGYQVLTCRSSKKDEPPFPTPPLPYNGPNVDSGCINTWAPYTGNNAPDLYGISAGNYSVNSTTYVGKSKLSSVFTPGRIQTVNPTGFYSFEYNEAVHETNGSFYLVDNANYTYKWEIFEYGLIPENAVMVRNDVGPVALPVTRARVSGHFDIGQMSYPMAVFQTGDEIFEYLEGFEILVCDPVPRYRCAQNWTTFNISNSNQSPAVNGFNIGTLNSTIDVYIGRSCDINLGRAQVSPHSAAGVYYVDDFTASEGFDNKPETTEYLVQNPNYHYQWVPSSSGVKVHNALGQHREGHQSYYIGMTRINGNHFVGEVKPGEGFFFIDVDGSQKFLSSYKVLTCTSNEPQNGIDDDSDSWYDQFWCPPHQSWSFEEERCI